MLVTFAFVFVLAGFASIAARAQTDSAPTPPPAKAPTRRQKEAANERYLAGAKYLDHRELAKAQAAFEKAAELDPTNNDYAMAAALAREHRVSDLIHEAGKARLMGQTDKADKLLKEAHALDPENSFVAQHMAAEAATPPAFQSEIGPASTESSGLDASPMIAGPIKLTPTAGMHSFHDRGNARDVLSRVVSAYGIKPVFDASVKSTQITLELNDVTYNQASAAVLGIARLFAVPIDITHILVVQDTADNRKRFERLLQETIYAPQLTTEQLNDLKNVVNNVFDIKKVAVYGGAGELVFVAPEPTLHAINRTLADMVDDGNEILLDLKLYSVDRTRTRDIGAQLPQQTGIYSVANEARQIVQANQAAINQAISQGLIPPGLSDIAIVIAMLSNSATAALLQSSSSLLSSTIGLLGGGLTMAGLTASPFPSFTLSLNSGNTRALDHIQLRVSDGQEATFKAGTKYPITTGSYSNGISSAQSSQLASLLGGNTINGVSAASLMAQSSYSIPQFQYQDLGLVLKAKPAVHADGRIVLKLDMKITAIGGTGINGIPILNNHEFVSGITVHDGETTMLASSLSESETAAVNGVPGLGELPGFQTATAGKTGTKDTSELVLLITPHIVHRRQNLLAGPRIALGEPGPD
ncbi:MAG: hypothetical protein FWD64_03135 [Acidobacteriaceae bacterium]|nr:hypothetical protein [Acidobacteriaceae bacterium]